MDVFGGLFGRGVFSGHGSRRYYRALVTVLVEGDGEVLLPPFTGKVVKSLLIRAGTGLERVFGSSRGPKPISVSPLIAGGRPLWKRFGSGETISCKPGSRLWFRLGFREDVADRVIDAVYGIDGVELFNARWRLLEVEIESYEIPGSGLGLDIMGRDMVVVCFRSPAILVDPYKGSPSNPRFLPLAGVLFSYNIGELMGLGGRDRRWDPRYWAAVDIVNAVLHEHRRILDKIYTVRYNYDGREGYGVGGYAVYYVVKKIIREHPWVGDLLENIIIHAQIMGVGASRANGFGYVEVKLE